MSQRRLGVIVGWWKVGVGDEGGDRLPVVEDFTSQCASFGGVGVLVAAASSLQPNEHEFEALRLGFFGDGVDPVSYTHLTLPTIYSV